MARGKIDGAGRQSSTFEVAVNEYMLANPSWTKDMAESYVREVFRARGWSFMIPDGADKKPDLRRMGTCRISVK